MWLGELSGLQRLFSFRGFNSWLMFFFLTSGSLLGVRVEWMEANWEVSFGVEERDNEVVDEVDISSLLEELEIFDTDFGKLVFSLLVADAGGLDEVDNEAEDLVVHFLDEGSSLGLFVLDAVVDFQVPAGFGDLPLDQLAS